MKTVVILPKYRRVREIDYSNKADYLISFPMTAQDQQVVNQIKEEKEPLTLIITDGHGNINRDGSPQRINNAETSAFKAFLQENFSNIHFQHVWMTSCFSASFIPIMRKYLSNDGIIISQLLSSPSLPEFRNKDEHQDFLTDYFSQLSHRIDEIDSMLPALTEDDLPFLGEAIYLEKTRTIYHFAHQNIKRAIRVINSVMVKPNELPDHVEEYEAVLRQLEKSQIQTHCKAKTVCELVGIVHDAKNASLTEDFLTISPMERVDLSIISTQLEPQIFADDPYDVSTLQSYFSASYSFVLRNSSNHIVGYIFTKKQNDRFFIGNFGLLPQYRGKGQGEKLLQHVLNLVDKEKKDVSLQVESNNVRAQALYQRMGFEVTSDHGLYTHMCRKAKSFDEKDEIECLLEEINKLINRTGNGATKKKIMIQKIEELYELTRSVLKNTQAKKDLCIRILRSVKTLLDHGINKTHLEQTVSELETIIPDSAEKKQELILKLKALKTASDPLQDQKGIHEAYATALKKLEQEIKGIKQANPFLHQLCQQLLHEMKKTSTQKTKVEDTFILQTLAKALKNPDSVNGKKCIELGQKLQAKSKDRYKLGAYVLAFGILIMAMAILAIGLISSGILPAISLGTVILAGTPIELTLGKGVIGSLLLGGAATTVAAIPAGIKLSMNRYQFHNDIQSLAQQLKQEMRSPTSLPEALPL